MSDDPTPIRIPDEMRRQIAEMVSLPREFSETINRMREGLREQNREYAAAINQIRAGLLEQNRAYADAVRMLGPALQGLRQAFLPENIRGLDEIERIGDLMAAEGIPLVHVPRAAITSALLYADDYEARLAVLREHVGDVLDDCALALQRPVGSKEEDRARELGLRAVEMYRAGFYEGAQSISVSLSELLIGLRYERDRAGAQRAIQKMVKTRDAEKLAITFFNHVAPLWVAQTLYFSWDPKFGQAAPKHLSRHVTSHLVTDPHVNPNLALIGLMQVASLVSAARWAVQRRGESEAQP